MAISTLNRAQAFGAGCDLWIIPEKNNFSFFNKLDWYLNFQLTKSHLHESQSLSPQLKSITNENQLPQFHIELEKTAPLLVSAEIGLPTKRVVEIPSSDEAKPWTTRVYNVWANLDRPTLRVFLPTNINVDDFKTNWPGSKTEDLTIVPSI
ncbi:MAG: hypothetical protein KDD38_04125 [Bdellovibrionales bacterium]|nr:hypothetical protein [Bdellovibrionales bacterium]